MNDIRCTCGTGDEWSTPVLLYPCPGLHTSVGACPTCIISNHNNYINQSFIIVYTMSLYLLHLLYTIDAPPVPFDYQDTLLGNCPIYSARQMQTLHIYHSRMYELWHLQVQSHTEWALPCGTCNGVFREWTLIERCPWIQLVTWLSHYLIPHSLINSWVCSSEIRQIIHSEGLKQLQTEFRVCKQVTGPPLVSMVCACMPFSLLTSP